MQLLADISEGNTGFADVMFLVGFILFIVAAFLLHPRTDHTYPLNGLSVVALGLAAVALGWLVL
jgi:uncharacterized membrane protein